MNVSILGMDDEPKVLRFFRRRFRCETRQSRYVFASRHLRGGDIFCIGMATPSTCMDGLQLLVEIKQRFTDLPVMMVTAYSDDERRRQAAEHGAAEFLTKPVDFERLKAQLGQLPIARIEKLAARSNDRLPARLD